MNTSIGKGYHKWLAQERAAAELLNVVYDLWLNQGVELFLFRRSLKDTPLHMVIRYHKLSRDVSDVTLTVHDSLEIARTLQRMSLPMSKIGIGRLGIEWKKKQAEETSLEDFLRKTLDPLIRSQQELKQKDVVLYGFGRIGRLIARKMIKSTGLGKQLVLRAVVVRKIDAEQLAKRAELLRNDSVHGPFHGIVEVDPETMSILVNGQRIRFLANPDTPDRMDYTQYGIDNALVIDSTGVWRDEKGLGQHLQARGVDKVLFTAPGKGGLPNIVFGVNHKTLTGNERIVTAASCTTNAIVPVLKVLDDHFTISHGHIETIHSYTNDQNLLDNFHKKYRRGRAAPLNLVITETGAGKAVAKALPRLKGKLTGNAVRVPTPDGSLAILHLQFEKPISVEAINKALRNASVQGALAEQIEFSSSRELVSSDIVGSPYASVVDGAATLAQPAHRAATVYVWYDNEYGYVEQVFRLAKYISRVSRPSYHIALEDMEAGGGLAPSGME